MKKLHYLIALINFMGVIHLHAQVSGKIIEIGSKGDTSVVPGVIIYWHTTSISTTSDANGETKKTKGK
jgi:hypothetical protein